ncbi:hypothetical protein N2152v2_005775 [Parachlorella kessleri]
MSSPKPQLLSVAPMMDWTDVHYRQLARLLSRHTWLYTEMVVDSTLIHNPDHDRFLAFPPEQHPIVCQLGGSDPAKLAAAAKIVAQYNYDEINLNCGCPSDRVAGAGCFGAALMLQPQLVADCCKAVAEAVAGCTSHSGGPPPITVKCRLGVDNNDTYEELCSFIKTVSEGSPVTHFIIHARKCHLKGLNPHQNRTVPPLRYEWVWALKRDFPYLEFSLNGGVLTLAEAAAALRMANPAHLPRTAAEGAAAAAAVEVCAAAAAVNGCGDRDEPAANGTAQAAVNGSGGAEVAAMAAADAGGATIGVAEIGACASAANRRRGSAGGSEVEPFKLPATVEGGITGVMIGRAAYNTPWEALADADRAVFGADSNPATSRRQVLEAYAKYADGLLEASRQRQDGRRGLSVRLLFKPLMGMFYNMPRGKKWRNAVDTALKTATSVSEVLEATLPVLLPETLDAPPTETRSSSAALRHFAPELPPQFDSLCSPAGKRVRELSLPSLSQGDSLNSVVAKASRAANGVAGGNPRLASMTGRLRDRASRRSVGTSAIAVTYFLRYFARKSMKRNDPFIIAAGCLFLATKSNDDTHRISGEAIVSEMLKRWYGRQNQNMRARLGDTAFVANMFASLVEAERAILYTVGFDFNIDLPHTQFVQLLRRPRFTYLKENAEFHQYALNFCNDVMRKDGTLVLQYTSGEIALAVFYLIFKAAKRENLSAIPQPEGEPDGSPWYVEEGLAVERCAEITARLNSLYQVGGPAAAASSQPAASVATTVMPGASSLGGPAPSESAAAVTVVPRPAGAEGEGPGEAVDSVAAPQRSPAPQQQQQQNQQQQEQQGSGSEQKRPREESGAGPASKVPRRAPPLTPPASQAASTANTPVLAAPPAACGQPAKEGSDKEEGELEEGEVA